LIIFLLMANSNDAQTMLAVLKTFELR